MTERAHATHDDHDHAHGPQCGHLAVTHGDHTCYVHDGHLHRDHDGHVDECSIQVDATNPAACTPSHACGAHDTGHVHAEDCGHPRVPHGDHIDYLVDGHLHFQHDGHCDHHGPLTHT